MKNPRTPRTHSIEPLEARIAPAAVAAINLADLDGGTGFKLSGVGGGDLAGSSLKAAGDVNGDGFADVIVGARYSDTSGNNNGGAAYVVFGNAGAFGGQPDLAAVDLSGLDGSNGFKLIGADDNDNAGWSVSGAGDVNGDGFDDVIVGALGAEEGGLTSGGAVYVIFGKADGFGASVALGALSGGDGFKLFGAADGDQAGYAVSGAGDVNGDGFDDVIVGAYGTDEGGGPDAERGAAYVVFGKAGSFGASVGLGTLSGGDGFKLFGTADYDNVGRSVSAAGDVNRDGFADVIVGARGVDGRGAGYVVFGKAGGFGASVSIDALDGSDGVKLSGASNNDRAGSSVSGAGDVNGDGFDDVIVGAGNAAGGGAAYVVFGKSTTFGASIDLGALSGDDGFKLSGINGDGVGSSVAAAGDVNGDSFDDFILGSPLPAEGGIARGAAYLIFGKAGGFGASMAVSSLNGSNGFKIPGIANFDNAGSSVSGAGDVNGDGFAELIIGAPIADGRGAAYVVHGFGTADAIVDASGKSATFIDWDGDLVTIKSSKGLLTAGQFHLSSPNPITGGAHLVFSDFTDTNLFTKSSLTFTAKRGPTGGDGLVNVGTIDARGVVLGTVKVDGDLQQLDAAGAAALTVYSLGQFAEAGVLGAPLTSTIDGTLGALTVKTDASRVILTAKSFGAVKALNLDGVQIFAAGAVNPATPAAALAIKSLTVGGTVRDSQILAGYDATGAASNADVAIGAVKVVGQWVASNLVAGVRAGDDGIFATGDTNETLVAGGNAIVAKITSITVGGAVFGTLGDLRDGFGFAAEEIGALSIGKAKVPLQKGARNDITALLAGVTGDVRARETGTPGAPAALIAGPAGPAAIGLGSLKAQTGFKVSGVDDGDLAGFSVSAAGDVNGDGFGDFIVGAERADEGGTDRGAAYVVFGKAGGYPAGLALAALDGANGFKLFGAVDVDSAGYSVSAAGDVNGDGFDDVIVGAPGANGGGGVGANRGEAYVIFGKAAAFSASIALGSLLSSDGFQLSGAADGDQAGFSVAGAGDVNGDGLDDLIIGANNADTNADDDRGAAYVVFGKAGGFGTSVPLATLDGSNGFKLTGAADGDGAGFSVAGAGDVNGDGFDDFLIGATLAKEGGTDRGAAYLVFGRAGGFGETVALSGLNGSDGFKVSGLADGDRLGYSLGTTGDVNGDGFDDIIVGAHKADEGSLDGDRGAAYVLFGKAEAFGAAVLLSGLNGADGFKLAGIADGDGAGISVSGAGDVNGDGLDDLIVGAFKADEGGLDANRGAAYVLFGQTAASGASMVLSAIDGTNGFKLSGVNFSDYAGWSVSGAGDVNGDGFADLLVGAYSVDGAGTDRGAAYVVYGFGTADVTIVTDGKSATFIDWDGDLVTIKSTKSPLDAAQFKLSSTNPLTGGAHLIYADFTAGAGFASANLTFTAKRGPTGGDGLVNVGTIDARGVLLGKVSVDGDLQQLDAAGAAGLTVYSLGQFAAADVHGAPLTSEIGLKLGALTVKTDASRVMLTAQTFGAIKAANLDGVTVLASGVVNPAKAANALAIKSLTVTGSVSGSQILAGYDATGAAMNADVQIGAVKVTGQWIASNLVAGVIKGIDGIFGTGDDARIGGGNAIVSKIASITIGGAAFGTIGNLLDGFGFVAEEIGGLKIGKAKMPLEKGAGNDTTALLVGVTGDLRVREVA